MTRAKTGPGVLAAVAVAILASGCSDGVPARDVDLTVDFTGGGGWLFIDYTLTNTGDGTLVAYYRVPGTVGDDVNRVVVTVDGDRVEIAKKIDHICHDEPQTSECQGGVAVRTRIGGKLLEPGEELSEHLELGPGGPAGVKVTRGREVSFCVGVAEIDEDNPAAPDGLYPPTSPQTVICSDPQPVFR